MTSQLCFFHIVMDFDKAFWKTYLRPFNLSV